MQKLGRRTFTTSVLATSAAYLLLPRSTKAADSRIEILVNEPIGTIAPETYSHFIEHLGAVIYDGIWVGEKSKIPNYNGIRKALVDNLRKLKPGVIRYPGGCFADQYDWRDGVGARDKRPTRVNFWADTRYKTTKAYEDLEGGPQKYESNHFGTTNSFRSAGWSARSLTSRRTCAAATCASFSSGWNTAMRRRTDDVVNRAREEWLSPQPHKVSFWGVGNESWGCGGIYSEEYATEFRKFTAWLPTYGVQLKLIGPVRTAAISIGREGSFEAWRERRPPDREALRLGLALLLRLDGTTGRKRVYRERMVRSAGTL
jgi:alpha-N-arabinofuranosidase